MYKKTLIPYFIIFSLFTFSNLLAQKEVTQSDELYENIEWSFVGPTRGGRSTAISGVNSNPYTFFMGTTGGGYGRQLMRELDGKTYLMDK